MPGKIDNLTPFTSDDNRASEAGRIGGANKKGSKHISTWIQEVLEDETLQAKYLDGLEYKELDGETAPIKAIVRVAAIRAIQGDQRWADWLGKYGYSQKIHLGNDPDNPLTDTKHMNKEDLEDAIREVIGSTTQSSRAIHKGSEQTKS